MARLGLRLDSARLDSVLDLQLGSAWFDSLVARLDSGTAGGPTSSAQLSQLGGADLVSTLQRAHDSGDGEDLPGYLCRWQDARWPTLHDRGRDGQRLVVHVERRRRAVGGGHCGLSLRPYCAADGVRGKDGSGGKFSFES